ncbi:hypothetical protein T265_03367 [Opisthorchis viverrini]|uniref:HORMA domain-containing protein n=1 Tax=Opisthorchis viverrini TaxID=6198 RepID=A0A075A3G4_OPIVI|nr:hypothetical protein T265_03367 [Opisthorchis viverrini]KER30100.1 hypothetical protein T265_03367 [Opisthorchis viverrini]
MRVFYCESCFLLGQCCLRNPYLHPVSCVCTSKSFCDLQSVIHFVTFWSPPSTCTCIREVYIPDAHSQTFQFSESKSRKDMLLLQLQEHFATALIRLNLLECTYPPIDFETTWELCVRLRKPEHNLNETSPMSWIEDSYKKHKLVDRTVFPIKSVDTPYVQMQVLLERKEEIAEAPG